MFKNALAGLAFLCAAVPASAEDLRFVALGDMPYGEREDVYPAYEALIGAVNARDPDLTIHVGDTKSGKTECTDQWLDEQRAYLDSFAMPVMYTPGDNEWTDCHRKKAGRFDPLDRLKYIRSTYFERPSSTFGRTKFAVEHQGADGYPENARFRFGGVVFVTAHVVGSNNGFEPRSLSGVREFFERDRANIEWMEAGFDAAGNADALVLAIHADMFEFDWNEKDERKWLRHSGFRKFGTALRKRAAAFGKPVLLVFGDSHEYRQFKPFPKKAPNLTALEVFGAKEMHAVEVTVRREGTGVRFDVDPLLNPAL